MILCTLSACSKELIYPTNGETIYRTGKNKQGENLMNKEASKITIFKSCQSCHGKNGDRIGSCNIQYSALINPKEHDIPYTDALIMRFLDADLKNDGSKARTGVKWQMSEQDKKDVIAFLKTL